MGAYCVRNTVTGRSFVGANANLPAILNRHRAQLRMNAHMNRDLQADWNAYGPDAFAFEVLDTLTPASEPGYDPAADLRALEALWLDRLAPYGERGYNRPPK